MADGSAMKIAAAIVSITFLFDTVMFDARFVDIRFYPESYERSVAQYRAT